MAQQLSFNGVAITTAKYDGQWFFNRAQVAEALGYKNSINYKGGLPSIEIGNTRYLPLPALQQALATATGERKTQAAGLLQHASDVLGISLALNKPGTMIADLDSTSADWAKASIELKSAKQLFHECEAKEHALWAQLEKERNNG